jgi:hypothetical protein
VVEGPRAKAGAVRKDVNFIEDGVRLRLGDRAAAFVEQLKKVDVCV